MFQQMWNLYQVSPTILYVNVQELKNITNKVLSNASGPLLRYEVGSDGNPYNLAAAGAVSFYFNPFTLNGGLRIPIRIHPRVPPGTIIGWTENLPIQYQSNEVPNVAEIKTRQDYYQIDWPIITRQRQVGVYAEEVLAVYAPFAMGLITRGGFVVAKTVVAPVAAPGGPEPLGRPRGLMPSGQAKLEREAGMVKLHHDD